MKPPRVVVGRLLVAWGTTLVVALDDARGQADVALCHIQTVHRWGTEGDITAYSIGTTSVNVGTVDLDWVSGSVFHPVISQNMYRYLDGRLEHIGQSWLKHSFCALQLNSNCDTGCRQQFTCLDHLTPGCQDPYAATRNGSQNLLGPKWQVNAHTGEFVWPYAQGDQGSSGTLTYKRLQVKNDDLGLNGATYIVEGQYVALDDAQAGNQNNNASHRYVSIGPAPAYDIGIVGLTQFGLPAISAWPLLEPGATVVAAQVPDDGRFMVGCHATDNGDGTWHYEYAVFNMNAERSAGSFSVPLTFGVQAARVGFHDVPYHSGDGPGAVNLDGSDWPATIAEGKITWRTAAFDSNPNANALRWATMYNFWFDANTPPEPGTVQIGLFKPGTPEAITVGNVQVPSFPACLGDLSGDQVVGPADLAQVLGAWGQSGGVADLNNDGTVGPADLAPILGHWGPCRP